MNEYQVIWVIEVPAESPLEAAKLALAIQRDTQSIATSFYVKNLAERVGDEAQWALHPGEFIDPLDPNWHGPQ